MWLPVHLPASDAFPTTSGAFQTKLKGKQDAVVLKDKSHLQQHYYSALFLGEVTMMQLMF